MTQANVLPSDRVAMEPCPFCGGGAVIWSDSDPGYPWSVTFEHVERCPLHLVPTDFFMSYRTEAEAIAAWNARHRDASVRELVEALEWYAEQAAGCRKLGHIGDPYRHALDADGGKRAREALATVRALVDALTRLRTAAAMLQQHSEGCAANHYGHDMEIHGMPGWLADTRKDIEFATAALASAGAQQ